MLNSFCRLVDHDGCSTPNPHCNQADGDGLVEVGPAGRQAGMHAAAAAHELTRNPACSSYSLSGPEGKTSKQLLHSCKGLENQGFRV